MKRMISLLLVLIIVFALSGCGKSQAVQDAEEAINLVGEVSLDSGEAIQNAERHYNILTDNEKEKVENRLTLI